MKKLIIFCLTIISITIQAQTWSPVFLGTTANDGTGDPLRTAFGKINHTDSVFFANKLAKTDSTYKLPTLFSLQYGLPLTIKVTNQFDFGFSAKNSTNNDWSFGAGYSGNYSGWFVIQNNHTGKMMRLYNDGTLLTDGDFQCNRLLLAGNVFMDQYGNFGQGGIMVNDMYQSGTLFNSKLIKTAHLAGYSSAPTITAGTGAGTGASVSLASGSTDLAGQIIVTTGTVSATGVILTVTFNTIFNTAPFVVFSPANDNASGAIVGVYVVSIASTFTLNNGSLLISSTQYKWNYHVIQ